MRLYLDTSALVALFVNDAHSDNVMRLIRADDTDLMVSDFARAEFAAVIGRMVRTRAFSLDEARVIFRTFDAWADDLTGAVTTEANDITDTEAILRRLDLGLRAPDALHIAIVRRVGATLATFDNRMADAARALALRVA